MLRAPSYLPNGMAYLGGRYYEQFGILTLTLGDTILCAKFDNPDLPEDFIYLQRCCIGVESTLLLV